MVFNLEWVVSILLVLFFAYDRFNTPAQNRSSTTRLRFNVAQGGYLACAMGLFVVLASSPQLVTVFLGGSPMPDAVKTISGPLAIALIMTTLLPRFPLLSRVDEWLLRLFQDIGEIPARVRSLADKLVRRPLNIDEESRRRMTDFIENRPTAAKGVIPTDLDTEARSKLHHRFTRLLHLHLGLEALSSERAYAAFRLRNAEAFGSVEKAVNDTLDLADKLFSLYRQIGGPPLPEAIGQSLEDLKRNFWRQFDAASSQVAELVARAILWSEGSEAERRRRLRGFGLAEEDLVPPPLPPNRVATVIAMLFAVFFGGITVLSQFAGDFGFPLHELVAVSTATALCFGGAVVAALWPKRRWRFATRNDNDGRPIIGYVLSGVMAALFTVLVGIVYNSLKFWDIWAALVDIRYSYPWYVGFFTASLVTAWLCDNTAKDGVWIKGALSWRLVEGGIACVMMVIAAWLACGAIEAIPDRPEGPEYPFWYVGALWGSAGAVIGFWAPYWYRRSLIASGATRPIPEPPPAIGAAAGQGAH